MCEEDKVDKVARVLSIYTKLMNGNLVNKSEEALNYGVNERSIQRDLDDIRNFLDTDSTNKGISNAVIYDRVEKGYRLEQIYKMKLSNSEILAISKILLESRPFTKEEMKSILERLIECCVPKENRKLVSDLIKNEEFHYIEPQHKKSFMNDLWRIGQAIQTNHYIQIEYQRNKDKAVVKRKIKPVAIMFSEFYFYVTAFINENDDVRKDFDVLNDSFPTIYRIDRIQKLEVLEERFHIPYSSRFEEGEFRKRIQFMYGGKLHKVKFECKEESLEAVQDRLPTAHIISEENGTYVLEAEVFGKGIDMWFKSQENNVKILKGDK